VISGEAQERDDEEEQGTGGDAPPSHRRQGMTPQKYSFFILFLFIFLGFFYWGSFQYTLEAVHLVPGKIQNNDLTTVTAGRRANNTSATQPK
jgi:hypothetical protein